MGEKVLKLCSTGELLTLICLRLDTPWAGYLPKLIWVIFIKNHSGSIKNLIINSSAQLAWNTIRFLIQKLLTCVSDFPLNGPFWQIETFSKYPAIIRIENYWLKIHYLFFFDLKYAYFCWGYTNFLNVITVHFIKLKVDNFIIIWSTKNALTIIITPHHMPFLAVINVIIVNNNPSVQLEGWFCIYKPRCYINGNFNQVIWRLKFAYCSKMNFKKI